MCIIGTALPLNKNIAFYKKQLMKYNLGIHEGEAYCVTIVLLEADHKK